MVNRVSEMVEIPCPNLIVTALPGINRYHFLAGSLVRKQRTLPSQLWWSWFSLMFRMWETRNSSFFKNKRGGMNTLSSFSSELQKSNRKKLHTTVSLQTRLCVLTGLCSQHLHLSSWDFLLRMCASGSWWLRLAIGGIQVTRLHPQGRVAPEGGYCIGGS